MSLVRQLDGEIEINNINETEFKIIFPLNTDGFNK